MQTRCFDLPGGKLLLYGMALLCFICFSLNAVLCRFALVSYGMEPFRYAAVRCLSGAAMLCVLWSAIRLRHGGIVRLLRHVMEQSSWRCAVFLFCYMICFACGYVDMPSATGTLIQNSAVQASMIGWGVYCGLRPSRLQLAGLGLAVVGLGILLLPGLASPPLANAALMALGGASWGAYCMAGRNATSPSLANAGNFLRASLLALGVLLFSLPDTIPEPAGMEGKALVCAVASGAGTSALGYTLWYMVLPRLNIMSASISQLSVPPITGIIGFFLLDEAISARLVFCGLMILVGIWMTLYRPAATRSI